MDLNKIPDEYVICAQYDDELGALQGLKDEAEAGDPRGVPEAAGDLKMAPEKELKLEHNNMHGWFHRLTKKDEATVREALGFVPGAGGEEGRHEVHEQEAARAFAEARRPGQVVRDAAEAPGGPRVDVAASFSDVFLQASAICAEIGRPCRFAEVAVSAPVPSCAMR